MRMKTINLGHVHKQEAMVISRKLELNRALLAQEELLEANTSVTLLATYCLTASSDH